MITTKEYMVIDAISKNSDVSQRAISEDAGLSLGLTNILVNRLVKMGYLKAKKLNARKISYLVTPKGLKEKTAKTYAFMKRSLHAVSSLRSIIEDYSLNRYDAGVRKFIILGSGELSDITDLSLKALNLEGVSIEKTDKLNGHSGAAVFNATPLPVRLDGVMNIWSEAEKLYGNSYEF